MLEEFAPTGFVKGDAVLNDAEVERLRVDLDRVLAGETVQQPALARNLLEHHLPLEMQVDLRCLSPNFWRFIGANRYACAP